jgi:hypothetical protein
VELVAVPATGGIQVHLPLVEHVPAPAPAPSQEAKPAPTDTHAVELGGPTLTADEDEAEVEPVTEARAPRVLDRTAVLVGTVAGFLGGAVSGAAVSLLLS